MVLAVGVFSCEDSSTDPLQMSAVKKGTVLALRGQQLTNIYSLGIPGAEFFPRIINGTEKFEFDATGSDFFKILVKTPGQYLNVWLTDEKKKAKQP